MNCFMDDTSSGTNISVILYIFNLGLDLYVDNNHHPPNEHSTIKGSLIMAHKFELTQAELKAYVDLSTKLHGKFFNAG